jgi:hypothetical protein
MKLGLFKFTKRFISFKPIGNSSSLVQLLNIKEYKFLIEKLCNKNNKDQGKDIKLFISNLSKTNYTEYIDFYAHIMTLDQFKYKDPNYSFNLFEDSVVHFNKLTINYTYLVKLLSVYMTQKHYRLFDLLRMMDTLINDIVKNEIVLTISEFSQILEAIKEFRLLSTNTKVISLIDLQIKGINFTQITENQCYDIVMNLLYNKKSHKYISTFFPFIKNIENLDIKLFLIYKLTYFKLASKELISQIPKNLSTNYQKSLFQAILVINNQTTKDKSTTPYIEFDYFDPMNYDFYILIQKLFNLEYDKVEQDIVMGFIFIPFKIVDKGKEKYFDIIFDKENLKHIDTNSMNEKLMKNNYLGNKINIIQQKYFYRKNEKESLEILKKLIK